jgi:hypothetical protein
MVIKTLFDLTHCFVTAGAVLIELFILMGFLHYSVKTEFIIIINIMQYLCIDYCNALYVQAFIFPSVGT